jgi:hypothetical protein
MHDYFATHLAQDRRRDLEREAARSRLSAATKRDRPPTTVPSRPRGVRAQLGMILGRSAVGG